MRNPRPPRSTAPAPIRERSGGGGRGERVDGVRATAAGQTAPPRRSAARAGGPVLGHGFSERPSGASGPRINCPARWRRRRDTEPGKQPGFALSAPEHR
jgi:hypothetical protein